MRIHCPNCGPRDSREFHYRGSAELIARPVPDADQATFLNYVYLRDNPAGPHRELWLPRWWLPQLDRGGAQHRNP